MDWGTTLAVAVVAFVGGLLAGSGSRRRVAAGLLLATTGDGAARVATVSLSGRLPQLDADAVRTHVKAAADAHGKIEAISLYRRFTGAQLKASKEAVERWL